MRKYKVRMDCSSFEDVVVLANSEKEAKELAQIYCQCPQNGMEFTEFLPVEKGDKPRN
jgi:hypothetical protein